MATREVDGMKCRICGKEFNPDVYHRVYCSRECGEAARKLRDRTRESAERLEKMSDPLPPEYTTCKNCGKRFRTGNAQYYCSNECYKEYRKKNSREEQHKAWVAAKAARRQKYGGKTLGQWIQESTACNLDYETYRALIEQGKTYEELLAQAPNRQVRIHQHKPLRGVFGNGN